MAKLSILPESDESRTVPLDGRSLVLGRGATCDVQLADPALSRAHAEIRRVDGQYRIADLDSLHGTAVNGKPVRTAVLQHGDVISLGAVRIRFANDTARPVGTHVRLADDDGPHQVTVVGGPQDDWSLPERRLHLICTLSHRLTALQGTQDLLEDAMDICFETLGFEQGAIAIRDPSGPSVEWPVLRNLHSTEGEIQLSRTILARALEHGHRSIISDEDAEALQRTESMNMLGIRSAMCVPLIEGDRVLGVIYGDRRTVGTQYTKEDADFLFALASHVSVGLCNSRLLEEQKRRVQLEQEISLARDVQEFLFPTKLPNPPGIKLAGCNLPGRHVSGDYYDAIELDDGSIAVLMADVTGKGAAASLLAADLHGIVRATVNGWHDPADALARWNPLIYDSTRGNLFITAVLVVVNPSTREVSVSLAGHSPPLVIDHRAGTCAPMPAAAALIGAPASPADTVAVNLPLGILEDTTYRSAKYACADAPVTLLLYTDGVTEAANAQRAQFGEDRLVQVLSQERSADPQALIDSVLAAVNQFVADAPQSDDISMVALHVG